MLLISLGEHAPLPSRASIIWSVLAGLLGGVALALFYRALASGQMGLAAPVAALIGAAIPTLADIALEGAPSRWSIAGFVLAVLAIWLITRPEPQGNNDETGHPKGVAMAALAGVGLCRVLHVHAPDDRLSHLRCGHWPNRVVCGHSGRW